MDGANPVGDSAQKNGGSAEVSLAERNCRFRGRNGARAWDGAAVRAITHGQRDASFSRLHPMPDLYARKSPKNQYP